MSQLASTVQIQPLNLAEILAQRQALQTGQMRMDMERQKMDRQQRLSDIIRQKGFGSPEAVDAVAVEDLPTAINMQNAESIRQRNQQQFNEDELDKLGRVAGATYEMFQKTGNWEQAQLTMLPELQKMGLGKYADQFMTGTPEAALRAAQVHSKWKDRGEELTDYREKLKAKAEIDQQYPDAGASPYYTAEYDAQGRGWNRNTRTGELSPMMAGDQPFTGAKWDADLLRKTEQAKKAGSAEGEAQGKASAKDAGYESKAAANQILGIIGQTPGEVDSLIENSTGSGVGAGVDAAAGLLGLSTKGALSLASLKPLAAKLTAIQPRFEGPQSDADRKYYQEMAGNLADPSTPNAQKLKALQEIRKLSLKYATQEAAPADLSMTVPKAGQSKYRIGQIATGPNGAKMVYTENGWQPQ